MPNPLAAQIAGLQKQIEKANGRDSRKTGIIKRLTKRAKAAEKLAFDRLKIIERLDANLEAEKKRKFRREAIGV